MQRSQEAFFNQCVTYQSAYRHESQSMSHLLLCGLTGKPIGSPLATPQTSLRLKLKETQERLEKALDMISRLEGELTVTAFSSFLTDSTERTRTWHPTCRTHRRARIGMHKLTRTCDGSFQSTHLDVAAVSCIGRCAACSTCSDMK